MSIIDNVNNMMYKIRICGITIVAIAWFATVALASIILDLVKENRVIMVTNVPARCEAVIRDNSYFKNVAESATTVNE